MEAGLRVRRARRGDFARVRALLDAAAPAERGERKRFRRLVSTLREDLYVAETEATAAGPLAGLAVIVYARGLGPLTAVVRQLRATSAAARTLLLDCAHTRAAARGCTRLELQLDADDAAPDLAPALAQAGWIEGPRTLARTVSP